MALFNIIAIGHLKNRKIVDGFDEVRSTDHGHPARNPVPNLQKRELEIHKRSSMTELFYCTNEIGCISDFL